MGAAVADEVGGARRRRGPATEDAGREKELSPPLPVGEGVAARRSDVAPPDGADGPAGSRRVGGSGPTNGVI